MKKWLFALAGVAVSGALVAQDTDQTLRIDVDLVNVLFAVRDKRGALIPNLTDKDFQVFEDGKQQTVKHFTRESDLPLTIGLLVDVSGSQENLIEVERHAASQFLQSVLRQKDMAFLISFGAEAELLQDSTNSVPLLRRGLESMRLNTGIRGIHPGPVPTASQPRGTILFDTIYLASTEKLRREVGRKVIVVISDGVDQGSRYDLRQAIESAHKADAIVYSIQYIDPSAYGWGYGGGDGDLKRMSEETGGRMFKVGRNNSLQDIFRQIQEEVRSQYALSYTPTNTEKNGEFRKLEIKPVRKDLKVQARKGYYATASTD